MGVEPPTIDELAAAGIYDPDGPDAAQRLELVRWLHERGFTLEEMESACARGDLAVLASDAQRQAGVTLSLTDLAGRVGLSREQLDDVRRAAGLEPVPADVPVFTEDDVQTFEVLEAAAQVFPWPALLQLLRVAGSSMARISEAATALFLHDVELPMRDEGASDLEFAQASMQATELAAGLTTLLATLGRLHLDQSVRRFRLVGAAAPAFDLAVGFVDLVGYTHRAATLSPGELASLVLGFEAAAHDVVTELGGRLVKLIGDEVMFVAVDAATGCAIARGLLDRFGADAALRPRGGLAYGPVISRSGDYYGPIVNLAARLADAAVPGEVLATPEVAAAAALQQVEPAGRRLLKGFTEPVPVVSLGA
jgi:class 3 adenylate cyclase